MLCRVCGREFDPHGFQVVIPGLGQGFDRVECALEASALGLPPTATAAPLATVLRPLPAGPPVGAAPVLATATAGERPPFLVSANLALLAAGTAVTIYLWLRVFGADVTPFSLPLGSAAKPFAQESVAAAIDLTPASAVRPQPESDVAGGGSRPATPEPPPAAPAPDEPADGGGGTLVSNPKPKPKPKPESPGSGTTARKVQPLPAPPPPAPAPEPPAAPSPRQSPAPGTPPA
ncbi:MAG TPA: hypothetical protein VD704_09140, partial [Gaiellaceae bacterium]|nr:hypothetical protein [Gaiellaceae bacterium]